MSNNMDLIQTLLSFGVACHDLTIVIQKEYVENEKFYEAFNKYYKVLDIEKDFDEVLFNLIAFVGKITNDLENEREI